MTENAVYNNLIAKRDYTGSKADNYAQLLQTLFFHIGIDLFPFLESAEAQQKQITIKESTEQTEALIDSYSLDDLTLS